MTGSARLTVGLGSSRGVRAAAVRAAVADALAAVGGGDVVAYATVDRRAHEPGLRAALDPAPLRCYPAAALDAVAVPTPSEAVHRHVGTRSVAEAAALLAARDLGGGALVVPKVRGEHVTVAVAALAPLRVAATCTACGGCLLTCPEAALRPAPGRPVVLADRCTSCGECVEVCPVDAITVLS